MDTPPPTPPPSSDPQRLRSNVPPNEIRARLAEHAKWLATGGTEGVRFESQNGENLSGARLENANLSRAKLQNANLSFADLRNANLSEARLQSATLSGARLRNANLTGAKLEASNLSDATLENAKLKDTLLRNAILKDATLREADLSGVDLREADLSGVDLREADLSGSQLWKASLRGADLKRANMRGARLGRADLCNADLELADLINADVRLANFDNSNVYRADLGNVRGLFGVDHAIGLSNVRSAEHANYAHPFDFASWALLRFIGTLHLFSASYLSFLAIVVYATVMRWVNTHVDRWHEWAREHAGNLAEKGAAGPIADLVERVPHLPVKRHFGILMAAIGLLAFATTLFAVFCPEPIKEATETRWTRELNQPLIEYHSAMYHRPLVRYATLVSFTLGGGYTLGYILWRAAYALSYLIVG